jgi:transposase
MRRPLPVRGGFTATAIKVERLWGRRKEWRAVATRYEKTASSFMGVLHLAATLDWLKR